MADGKISKNQKGLVTKKRQTLTYESTISCGYCGASSRPAANRGHRVCENGHQFWWKSGPKARRRAQRKRDEAFSRGNASMVPR